MTTGSREGIGVDGDRNPSKKPEGCDEEESAEQASEEHSTKGDGVESLNPSTTALNPGTATVHPASSPSRTGHNSTQQLHAPAESTQTLPDQHHFLRSSVRPPSKRIRKDSVGSTINGHGGAKAKGTENGSTPVAVGQSGAVASSTGASRASKAQASVEKDEQTGNQKRARRQWESWSAEDKNSFFEGLYEYGKDFEAIQNNIAIKYKKRGKPANMVKNKEQVRHFYYRTWHKISKHIDFVNVYSRTLKKSSQELYGLICYAELRKKVGGMMDDKNVAKLNELIQQGATTVRSKGRNLRIKAPMCRALKKLCDPEGVSDEEDQKPVRLPLKMAVELQPRSSYSWARVQNLAHNPRLRMIVELHRKVSSLIEYLKQKWTYQDQWILKSLMEREALEGGQSSASSSRSLQDELVLYPAESSTLTTLPGVARVAHSKAFCTVHWLESGKNRPNNKDLPAAQILGIHSSSRSGSKLGKGVSTAGIMASGSVPVETKQTELYSVEPACDSAKPEEKKAQKTPSVTPQLQEEVQKPEGEKEKPMSIYTNGSILDLCDKLGTNIQPSEECREEQGAIMSSPETNRTPPAKPTLSEVSAKERTVEQLREEGWSARDPDSVTLAELYLMFGKPGKLQLEYDWQPISAPDQSGNGQEPVKPTRMNSVLRCLLKLVSSEANPKPLVPDMCSIATSPLKTTAEEHQAVTPPGKTTLAGIRSPGYSRQQIARGGRLLHPNAGGRSQLRPLLGSESEGAVFAVPTTLPPNSSRHNRMFSPNKEAELALKQQLDSISMQSDLFSRQRKPRNRQLRKPLVVQRTLLPRTTGDASQHVCSFSILSNSSATGTGSFRPIQTRLTPAPRPIVSRFSAAPSATLSSAIDFAAKSAGIIPDSCPELSSPPVETSPLLSAAPVTEAPADSLLLQDHAPENRQSSPLSPGAGGGDSILSPPSVASLLDISLPGPPEEGMASGEHQTHISDSIIELAINSAHYGEEGTLSKLTSSDGSKLLAPSPSVSPSQSWMPSPCHDPQWYPSDSSDSTLGCLLSSMVSPDKGRRTTLTSSGPSSGTALLGPSLLDCNSHDSFQSRGLPDPAEVDSQLACMMSESSVDYIARFNDLAQELAVAEPPTPPP
ncbi:unnamed protein product [Knipowitschia caucasica]